MKYLAIFSGSFFISLVLTPLLIKLAKRFNVLDIPKGNLKTHKTSIPYLGGIAIYLAFVISLIIERFIASGNIYGLIGIIVGGTAVFFLGLVDDIKKVSIPVKFLVEISVSIILILCDIKIKFFHWEILNIAFTVLWVVGLINAFNIIDIMDGLCAGVAIIASIAFFILGAQNGKLFSPLAALSLAGGCFGFLIYNFNPARIFMGDAGSLFIGFILSALALTESYTEINKLAVFAPIFILGIPIFDTIFVMFIRYKKHIPVVWGSPDHFPLRMEKLGLSRKKVVLVIYGIAIFLCTLAYLSTKVLFVPAFFIYLIIIVIVLISAYRLSFIKM